MANLFEYEKEAIRIKAKRTDLEKEEFRKELGSWSVWFGITVFVFVARNS